MQVANDAYFHREHMTDPLVAFTVGPNQIAKARANYAAMDAKFNETLAEVEQALKNDATKSAVGGTVGGK